MRAGSGYLWLLWVLAVVLKTRAWLLCPPGFSTESAIADIKTQQTQSTFCCARSAVVGTEDTLEWHRRIPVPGEAKVE